jgi:hypothetical protein
MGTSFGVLVTVMTRSGWGHPTGPLAILCAPNDRGDPYMTRRFQVGPILVFLAAIVLLVSLFLDWYGSRTAWDAFEMVDVVLAVAAIAASVTAVGLIAPDVAYVDRRWLPAFGIGAAVLIAAQLDPPPVAADENAGTGAWIAFASSLVMVVGAVLSFGRVSLALSVDNQDVRERVAVVDHRQDTAETAAVNPRDVRTRTGE